LREAVAGGDLREVADCLRQRPAGSVAQSATAGSAAPSAAARPHSTALGNGQ